jgi:hypothetical protein
MFASISLAQPAPPPCDQSKQKTPEFLHCVVGQIDTLESRGTPIEKAATQSPLNGFLDELGRSLGYTGAQSDVDALKSRSSALKQADPGKNWDAIVGLDYAISSHVTEIGPAVSTHALSSQSENVGKDIFEKFVRQKLSFLGSDSLTFYDRGPFEITAHSLLANSLESKYFLDREHSPGSADASTLRKEMAILDDIYKRYTDNQHDYLPRNDQQSRTNSNRFWRASISLLAGDSSGAREILKTLASQNAVSTLESHVQGQVYVYKVYDHPYQIIVDSIGKTRNIDANVLNRLYNPAQLALLACAFVNEPGAGGAELFEKEVKEFVSSDYSVVVASTGEQTDRLIKLRDQLTQAILNNQALSGRLNDIAGQINQDSLHILQLMQSGAQQCGISDSVRTTIFAPFDLEPRIEVLQDNTKRSLLLVGRYLNANQASAVSDFINGALSSVPDLRNAAASLGGAKAVIARVPPQ